MNFAEQYIKLSKVMQLEKEIIAVHIVKIVTDKKMGLGKWKMKQRKQIIKRKK